MAGHAELPGVDLLPPATRGAVATALQEGYTRIGVVDGAIEGGSRLTLRELRSALRLPNVELVGGASAGAIWAAQLQAAGMRGIGRVFRLLRRRSITEAEDIYFVHASAALQYRHLSLPLINVHYTLRAMRRQGHLSAVEEHGIARYMRAVPWFDRSRHYLAAAVYETCARSNHGCIMQAFERSYRDIRREDAFAVASALAQPPGSHTVVRTNETTPLPLSRAGDCAEIRGEYPT
jgi:hypothetical protein